MGRPRGDAPTAATGWRHRDPGRVDDVRRDPGDGLLGDAAVVGDPEISGRPAVVVAAEHLWAVAAQPDREGLCGSREPAPGRRLAPLVRRDGEDLVHGHAD